jgi:4,5-DOPA dioxygenase extradiol
MFPQADIPVMQLSIDYSLPPQEHFALGQQLRSLRERGVLVVGSGNIVHNLRASRRGASPMQAHDWAFEFDRKTAGLIEKGDLQQLGEFQKLGALAAAAHPTHDHYLPLLTAAGAAEAGEKVRFFNERYQSMSMAMRSVVWG